MKTNPACAWATRNCVIWVGHYQWPPPCFPACCKGACVPCGLHGCDLWITVKISDKKQPSDYLSYLCCFYDHVGSESWQKGVVFLKDGLHLKVPLSFSLQSNQWDIMSRRHFIGLTAAFPTTDKGKVCGAGREGWMFLWIFSFGCISTLSYHLGFGYSSCKADFYCPHAVLCPAGRSVPCEPAAHEAAAGKCSSSRGGEQSLSQATSSAPLQPA